MVQTARVQNAMIAYYTGDVRNPRKRTEVWQLIRGVSANGRAT